MKANELMIGDWVHSNHHGENIKITQYDFFTHVHNECGEQKLAPYAKPISGKDFEPIPLTPEILEKNGFYYGYTSNEEDLASNTIVHISEDDKGWCWDEGGGSIKVIFPNEADAGMLILDDQSFDRYLEFVYITTIYVHELQHVMRLCRIEKEIEL